MTPFTFVKGVFYFWSRKGKLYISIGKEDWHEENSGKKLRPEGD